MINNNKLLSKKLSECNSINDVYFWSWIDELFGKGEGYNIIKSITEINHIYIEDANLLDIKPKMELYDFKMEKLINPSKLNMLFL